MVLLDTTEARALIVLGDPKPRLLGQVAAMMSVLRQRIDVIVGTSTGVDALGKDFRSRWRVKHTLAIPEPNVMVASTARQTWITRNVAVDLGKSMSMSLIVSTRENWKATGRSHRPWIAVLRHLDHAIVLSPDTASVMALGYVRPILLVVPESNPVQMSKTVMPAAIATNAAEGLPARQTGVSGTVIVRTYPEDVSRFELRQDGVVLPTWAEKR